MEESWILQNLLPDQRKPSSISSEPQPKFMEFRFDASQNPEESIFGLRLWEDVLLRSLRGTRNYSGTNPPGSIKVCMAILVFSLMSSCYFFRKRPIATEEEQQAAIETSLENLGRKAGTANSDLLAELNALTTTHAPAPLRPDPDVFVRRLLLQYRAEGATIARQIGRVEQFRGLLGGPSQDFSVPPQETYDATSLLAKMKVAEEICKGLVDPNPSDHPGWTTILPAQPSDVSTNTRFLAQRILGVPSSRISDEMISELEDIYHAASTANNSAYVLVCTTLVIDAQSLLL